MNKLPNSMKNVGEKIKNIHIPSVFPEPLAAGVGNVGERKTLGALFSAVKSGTKGTGNSSKIDVPYGTQFRKTGNKKELKPNVKTKQKKDIPMKPTTLVGLIVSKRNYNSAKEREINTTCTIRNKWQIWASWRRRRDKYRSV